ncbi:elongation factor P maturation arginine rhamnosyltransferase EarP, partial [Pseudomonas syringae group genomosp. 7]|uniref:elongation factor P maturation arginine rhamnosyltransferase EarP n=1 Tax=Pseudomonas syringae group genomosp. 7 TaxID=251699 RepID=UPI0037700825
MQTQGAGKKASRDILCSVVDKYGDAAVTWRLARQLIADQGLQHPLWIEDLSA